MKLAPHTPVEGPRAGSESGSILVLVLWISFGLVALTVLFAHSMYLEFRSADNRAAGIQAEQALMAGIRHATAILELREDPNAAPDPTTYEAEAVVVGDGTFWFLGRNHSDATFSVPAYELIPEAARLDLNTVPVEILEALPRMTPELAAAIVDWRDEDDEETPGGAESSRYSLLDPPRECKNAPFESIEELFLVIGAADDILFGEDTNRNGLLDPNENDGGDSPPDDNQNGILEPGILEYLTVHAYDPEADEDEDSNGGVHVLSASEAVLAALPGMDQDKAGRIIAYREGRTDLEGLDWIAEAVDAETLGGIEDWITMNAQQFAADIIALGHHGRGYRRVRVVIDAAQDPPVVVSYKDLQGAGWALPAAALETLRDTSIRYR